ncbi:MAG: MotA/TolQ/ExbB proton channel family protein [Deltaproteobacteria bacterium]|nr:MAG: MotA/TolQ/ExbB proton channel family protein [Deltaproteobacteria bacterium]
MDWLREILDTIVAGGPVMIPLALCSIVALGAFMERLVSLRRGRVAPSALVREVEPLLEQGDLDGASAVCRRYDSALSRLVLAAIALRLRPAAEQRERIEQLGRQEAATMERFVPIVGTVASIAPLLGLLGTVGGMIVTFAVIQEQGMGDVAKLAGGISQALVTTFAGLSVGIPALIANRFLLARVDALLLLLEEETARALSLIRSTVGGSS